MTGVKDVDGAIQIMLHIDRGGDPGGYTGAGGERQRELHQQRAEARRRVRRVWRILLPRLTRANPASSSNSQAGFARTFAALAEQFPKLRFVAAEYGPMQREINDLLFGLPGMQGAGHVSNWEPTQEGAWNSGHALFSVTGNSHDATPDLALYDAMKTAYASRL